MPTVPPTVAECDAKITELEAERESLRRVPTRGSVGRTSIDLGSKRQEVEEELELWRERRLAAFNGGRAVARSRVC